LPEMVLDASEMVLFAVAILISYKSTAHCERSVEWRSTGLDVSR
jgi:hypothetical protein